MSDDGAPALQFSQEFTELVAQLRSRPFKADTTPIPELRANFEKFAASLADPPPASFREDNANGVQVEWTTAPGCDTSSVVLYLHGGGYSIGSIAAYRDFCARISAGTGVAVLSVGYRLAPEHPFPAALDDTVTAYRWLIDQVGIVAENIVVAGDSAGGGLAVTTMLVLRDRGLPLPKAAVCISPLTDLAHTGSTVQEKAYCDPVVTPEGSAAYGQRYMGEKGDLRNPLASPVYAELTGLPPVLIQVGTSELLLDDSLLLARKLRDAGGTVDLDVWPGMIHIFPFFASRIPEARRGLEYICNFISARLDRSSPSEEPALTTWR